MVNWIPFWHINGRTVWVRKHGQDAYSQIRDGAVRLVLDTSNSTLFCEAQGRGQIHSIISAIHDIKQGTYDISPDVVDPEDVERIRKGFQIKKILVEFVGSRRSAEYNNVEELTAYESKTINIFKRRIDLIFS
jgi:hypothetical protein